MCPSATRVLPGYSRVCPFLLTILLTGKNLLPIAEQKWFEGLRRQIKHRCGPGWGIDARHGGVRLTRRIAAGKQHQNPRQTVQLGIPWNPAYGGDIFLVVCQIRERMEKGEESLAKAFQLLRKQHGATPTVSKSVDDEDTGWQAVIDDFTERRRQNSRSTKMSDLTRHMKRVMQTLAKKPRPQSGADRDGRWLDHRSYIHGLLFIFELFSCREVA